MTLTAAACNTLPLSSCCNRQQLADWLARGNLPPATRLETLQQTHPHLFSGTVYAISAAEQAAMDALIATIESVIALPAWREAALADAPALARLPQAARGVFMGYDFHCSREHGPQLIEINTNAGGGLLSSGLAQALQTAQAEAPPLNTALEAARQQGVQAEADFVTMFRAEWALAHAAQSSNPASATPLRHIVIVDEAPLAQYLAPEFLCFQRLFAEAGITAQIADPQALLWDAASGRLCCHNQPVDLVYNRLTDFALGSDAVAALRAAYEASAVVVTPHPEAHALYADKRNLVRLSDRDWLTAAGVPEDAQRILQQGIPKTVLVNAAAADYFWQTRKQWFFKPADGFGSRAAYRGEKLTKRVFESILQGNYIAQALVPPSERAVQVAGKTQWLKADLRNYVYQGTVQLRVARLYQGQTTNFRTPGGGFAPVVVMPE